MNVHMGTGLGTETRAHGSPVCAGDPDALRQLATGSRHAAVLPAELEATAVDMAVAWCNLLAHDRSATPGEVNVGLAGLASAVVLAAGQRTALHFLCKDGARQLLGAHRHVEGMRHLCNAQQQCHVLRCAVQCLPGLGRAPVQRPRMLLLR